METPKDNTAAASLSPALGSLRSCRSKAEVRDLMHRLSRPELDAAWQALDPAARGALELVRAFDGVIVEEFDDASLEEINAEPEHS